jgi:hypothetical protein
MAKESNSSRKTAKQPQRKTKSAADASRDLEARQQDIDKVKGGQKIIEDPCAGGQVGIIKRR